MNKRDYKRMGRKKLTGVVSYPKELQRQPVIPNQVVTPSQMLKLAEQGIPISTQIAPNSEGNFDVGWDIPQEQLKHVDPAELWQTQQNVKNKVKKAHKRDKDLYGE